ncbi:beta-galactosidase [Deinococcus sp. 12RED42]|uniref:beta-galactosidase n=1 Tax=Deinococcus sp. 12RED42 TaxID=2745872 RepID=UPI001E3B2BB1|nr:beta-galactosidase [Deinococcus sp. 12RED42]MCD0166866.1 beta-galactosidase [Deinococcus sp. 12RED42]
MFDIRRFGGVIYGADYNPEQWPREVWAEDVRLMNEAGVNLVSLGIFSWAQLERGEGDFDFGWLDEVMDLLHAGGVDVNLATATASPPPWFSLKYPDSRPVTVDGVRLEVGGRQGYCPSHPALREGVARLTRAVATRYARHPALKLWHINNEYGCHIDQCFCEHCARRFRAWLEARYATIDALNDAWGTAFWSQRYTDWAEIQPPRRAPTYANPTQQLDWRRFSSDNILELHTLERGILTEMTPDVPATTNFLGFLPGLDYFRWAQEEDVVSLDAYPDPGQPDSHLEAGMVFDLTRSLGGGNRWILMEQATSAVNWRTRNAPKAPGQMRMLNHLALAKGASGIMFFQWRASKAGAEKFHSGLVQHVGPERSRVWREVTDFGAELRELTPLLDARVPARVAVMFDWHNWWALNIDSKPGVLPLLPLLGRWYAALRTLGQNVDFVAPGGDLEGYDVVVLPNLYLMDDATGADLRAFTERGGHLIAGYFTGVVDSREHVHLGGYGGPLRDVLGLWVEEWDVLLPGQTNTVTLNGQTVTVTDWCDVLHLDGAEAVATYEGRFYAGQAAVTRHTAGQGTAWYVGTELPAHALRDVLRGVLDGAGVPHTDLPATLDLSVSQLPDGSHLLHLLSADPQRTQRVQIPAGGTFFPARPERGGVGMHVDLAPFSVTLIHYPGPVEVSAVTVQNVTGQQVSTESPVA